VKQKISLKQIELIINDNIDKLTDFDSWMLYSLKNLVDELNYNRNENTLLPYGKKVIEFIRKDFCDLYMEISKIQD
jgi:valyl-tRNA synthetase